MEQLDKIGLQGFKLDSNQKVLVSSILSKGLYKNKIIEYHHGSKDELEGFLGKWCSNGRRNKKNGKLDDDKIRIKIIRDGIGIKII